MRKENWDTRHIPDQQGKVAVVTGANSGLGWHISLNLARQGAHVVMACRDAGRTAKAMDEIKAIVPHARLSFQAMNLARLDNVRAGAAELLGKHARIDLLVNNAGVMFLPYSQTPDGHEIQMASNHLGHFLLTGLLLDRLNETSGARIVTMSSGFNRYGRLPQGGFKGSAGYSKYRTYCDSKLANLVFARELAQRLQKQGARTLSLAAHPGYSATNLQFAAANMARPGVGASLNRMSMRMSNALFAQTAAMGALPALFAATGPVSDNGAYFGPDGWNEIRGYPKQAALPRRALDAQAVSRFWEMSEQSTGWRY